MATAAFIHDGNSIDYTPASDVAAGDVVILNDLLGVAKKPIAAGTLGALALVGVFEMPKATGAGSALAAGESVYWDATNTVVTTNAIGTHRLGKTILAAGDNDAKVRVRVEQ